MGRFNALELEEAVNPDAAVKPQGEPAADVDSCIRAADRDYAVYNYEKALRGYAKALDFNHLSTVAWAGQIRCLICLDEYREALMWNNKAMAVAGETAELLALKATIMCRMGDFDRAYGLCDAALEIPGNSPWPWLCRGELLLHGKPQNAGFCFDKAMAAEDSVLMVLEVGRRLIFNGFYTRAMKMLKEAQVKAPEDPAIWFELGRCYRFMGMNTAALAAFSRTLELAPEFNGVKEAIRNVRKDGFFKRLFRRMIFWR